MRTRLTTLASGVLTAAIAATALVVVGQPADAYTGTGTGGAPIWTNSDSASVKGSVLILDASGNQVTSGSAVNAIGTYLATSAAARTDATNATASVASPDPANAIPSTWASNTLPNTNYGFAANTKPAGAPTGAAFVLLTTQGANVPGRASALELYPNIGAGSTVNAANDANYLHTLELRIQDSGPSIVDDGKYFRTVVEYNPVSAASAFDGLAPGAWRQVYPAVSVPSKTATITTTPTAVPSGSQLVGTSIVFSTTVVPASGTLTGGTVTFFDGASQIGGAKTVPGSIASGSPVTVASDATTTLTVGTHQIKATFTPSSGDAATFAGSESSTLAQVITSAPAVADTTATTISSTAPAGSATVSDTVTVTAHVTDSDNPGTQVTSGTVAIKAGSTVLGQGAVDASGNVAVTFVAGQFLSLGANSLTAEYTGNASFKNSVTALATTYTVTLPAPANLVLPTPGAARVGAISTCNPGAWSAAFAYTYEWFQRATASSAWSKFAATRSTAALPAGYAGHQVKCVVTAYNPTATVAESLPTTVALGAASRATTKPRILGKPAVGKKLTAYRGVWSPAATRYLYVWKIGTAVVARTATYIPPKKFRGKYLVLVVSAVRTGYLTGSAVSARVLVR